MSLPPPTRAKDANRLMTEPRPGSLPSAAPRRLPRLTAWFLVGLAFVIGLGIGVLVMRHRHEGQKTIAAVNGVDHHAG